jgi:hypothetical protein
MPRMRPAKQGRSHDRARIARRHEGIGFAFQVSIPTLGELSFFSFTAIVCSCISMTSAAGRSRSAGTDRVAGKTARMSASPDGDDLTPNARGLNRAIDDYAGRMIAAHRIDYNLHADILQMKQPHHGAEEFKAGH